MTSTRRIASAWPLLLALAALTGTGCTRFLPSDPIPPSLGIRPEGDSLGTLWTGEGFAHHAAHPAASFVPPHIGVAHEDPTGDGRDGVFTVRTIEQATLGPGEYWTDDGPMTTDQIDDQLDCGE